MMIDDTNSDFQLSTDIMMEEYANYFSSCGLCLNPDKCAVMVFRFKPKTKEIVWNAMHELSKVKLLGVWLDSKYTFEDHMICYKNLLIQVVLSPEGCTMGH